MLELRRAISIGIFIALAIIVALTIITVAFVLAYLASQIHIMLGYVVFAGIFLLLLNCAVKELKCF